MYTFVGFGFNIFEDTLNFQGRIVIQRTMKVSSVSSSRNDPRIRMRLIKDVTRPSKEWINSSKNQRGSITGVVV